ncbi:DUF4097 family beta strand repeat-containing protein [Paenibacillus yanchengensis]|uniref:DUF4097 family beta strand repeat-containing protein n=1 Tax=Paenibacillus yanchengensis TaxID=2035833 RepID=A0ABW4YGK7_9BACL
MKKSMFYVCFLTILLLGGCTWDNNNEEWRTVSLKAVQSIEVDQASTTVEVETANIDQLEVAMFNGAGIVMEEERGRVRIRTKSNIVNLFRMKSKPKLLIRIPTSYKEQLVIKGSSGHTKVNNVQLQQLEVLTRSGHVSLEYDNIDSNILVIARSGNIRLFLKEKEPNVQWLLESNSGKRSIQIPLENPNQTNKKTEGQTGNGAFRVHFQTTSGNINVN